MSQSSPQPGRTPLALIWTALGLGKLPIAPGTWGSFGAAGIVWLLYGLGAPGFVMWLLAVAAFVATIWVTPRAEEVCGKKDPGEVVIDEVCGQWIAAGTIWLSFEPGWSSWWFVGVSFVLFRVFDVIKPPPCRQLERLPQGWGVALDDVVAGIFACVGTHVIVHFVKPVF